MARRLEVVITGDASSLSKALNKADTSASRFGSSLGRFGATVGKVAKVSALAAGAAGIGGLAVTMRQGIKEFSEAAKVGAQTGAVLKSTGGAAKVTARQVEDLSASLMRQSGVDDELIQSGQNVLLTFTKIRNEAGKGNDVFKQATQATLNLSVALGKDMQSSAILVGKALNDPIKGMSALSRAGIQFTEDQKKTIKALVETGDTLGAQKMILKELETQFGGSAKALGETLPGQINLLKESFNNLAGDLVGKLVPTFTKVVEGANDFIAKFSEAKTAGDKFRVVVDTLKSIADAGWKAVSAAVRSINWGEAAAQLQAGMFKIAGDAFRFLGAALNRVNWGELGRMVGQNVVRALKTVTAAFQAVDWAQAGRYVVQAIGTFLSNVDWGAVLKATFNALVAIVRAQAQFVMGAAKAIGAALIDGIIAGLSGLASRFKDYAVGQIQSALDGIKGFFGISSPSRVTDEEIGKPLAQGIIEGIKSKKDELRDAITNDLGGAMMAAFDDLTSKFKTQTEKLLEAMDFREAGKRVNEGVKEAQAELRAALNDVQWAQVALPGEDEEQRQARMNEAIARVVAAQEALDQAKAAKKRLNLERQAEQERKDYEERRAVERIQFQAQLETLTAHLMKVASKHKLTQEDIQRILKGFSPKFKARGFEMADAIRIGINDAAGGVIEAAQALAREIAKALNVRGMVQTAADSGKPGKVAGMARGGPVSMGQAYLVGEKGPELFVPGANGTIIPNTSTPNTASGGGATVINVNLPNYLGSPQEVAQVIRRELIQIGRRNGDILGGLA